jgi:hypothetical protein
MSRTVKLFVISVISACVFAPRIAGATSYDVSAVVPFPVPTTPATFDSGLLGQSVQSPLFQVAGTCEFVSPATVVSIFRAGSSIGSTPCSPTGRFQLDIGLVIGVNTLIARSLNISNEYGPDSIAGTVTLSMPTNTRAQIIEEQKVQSNLNIVSENPFIALTENSKTAIVSIVVSGGETPYTIELNWGDGTVESRKVDVAGTYVFTHEYAKPGTYRAVAVVTDVLGVQREHYFAVVNAGPISEEKQSDSGSLTGVCDADSRSQNSPLCRSNKAWFEYLKIPLAIVAIFFSGVAFGALRTRKRSKPTPKVPKNDKKK